MRKIIFLIISNILLVSSLFAKDLINPAHILNESYDRTNTALEVVINTSSNTVIIDSVASSSTTASVTIYPAANIPVDIQSVIASSTTNNITAYPSGTYTMDDSQYTTKVSTYAAGEIYATGSVSITFDVDKISTIGLDGKATFNINGGEEIYFSDTVAFSSDKLERLIPSPTLNFTLIDATTVWYTIIGVQ